DIGTTFTVQLIAFRVTDAAPLLIGLGFTTTFVARRRVLKDVGQALLGLGLLFLGLKLILDNAGTLKASPLAVDLLDAVANNPVVGVLAGAVFSALVTSSAATLGLTLAFAHQGLLSLLGAVAVVLGANIGTCVTALTASIGASAEAKRVAVAHIALQILGGVLARPYQELLEDASRRDDQVDFLEREIKLFLTRLGREAMGPDFSRKEIALISFIGNVENIGDIIDKNLMELARKKLYQGRRFSDAGWAEILEFHGMVSKNLETAIAAFAANDRTLAQHVLDQRPFTRQRERELRESHLGRLRAGLAESLETSEIHLDILTNLKRISSHVSALVFPILEEV